MFVRTTAINKIGQMKARKKVIQGGTWAGKTYAIIPILIDRCTKEAGLKVTIVAETIPAVKDGAVDIFKEVMQTTNRWFEPRWTANPMVYRFANGSRIQFKSFDTVGKAKAAGKRDILFLNEANHIDYNIADALMTRTTKEIFIDFNPDNEFWVHTETLKEPNSEFLKLTYKDNEALPKEILKALLIKRAKAFFNPELPTEKLFDESNIKSSYWTNWWQVYGLGLVGVLEGVIFQSWELINTVPKDAKLIARGLDFGYSNDPTACVELWQYNGKYILNEIIYQKGLTNNDIVKLLKANNINHKDLLFADASEPKSIKEISDYGFNIKAAKKGKDSINFGISLLQEIEFYVTENSINLIKELRNYKWDTDRTGKTLNRPIDAFNHLIDALRYVAIMVLKHNKKTKKKATWGKVTSI